jgi:hypothetical protein
MIRIMPQPVLFLAGLATLMIFGAKADAQLIASGSSAEQVVNRVESASDSWAPYQSEFSEVSGCIRSALSSQAGFFSGGFVSALTAETAEPLPQSASGPGVPDDKIVLNWLNPFDGPSPAAETGGSTSSNSAPERTNSLQSGLLAQAGQIRSEAISWLTTQTHVLPGTPMGARLFRPPRAAA